MTLKGHYALCFKTRTPLCCCYLLTFLVSHSVFCLINACRTLPFAGAIMAFTVRKLKQITDSLGVGKDTLHPAFSLRQHGSC